MRYDLIVQMIGNTPLVRVGNPVNDAGLWVKLEGYNPSGSIKDRACISIIRDAIDTGKLKPGMTLLDASSGNMACALAYFGKILGYGVKVVCSTKLTAEKSQFIKCFGGDIELVGNFTIEGNQHCRDVLLPQDPERYCFLDQLHNWANPAGSYTSMGPELLEDIPDLTAVISSLGSGGSLLGTGRYLKENSPKTSVYAVQASSGTKIPGVGAFDDGDYITPFITAGYEEQVFQHTLKVSIADAKKSTKSLADQGIFVGFQTGASYSGALLAIKEHDLQGDVVFLSGDSGWKNIDSLMGA